MSSLNEKYLPINKVTYERYFMESKSKTTNFYNLEKLNSDLAKFYSIYQYMKLNGISLPKN